MGRQHRGVTETVKHLYSRWHGDTEFPSRIKASRNDGVFLWYLPSDEVRRERDRLKAENAELRRLVHTCAEIVNHGCKADSVCDSGLMECPYDDSRLCKCGLCRLNDRLRELGIEV